MFLPSIILVLVTAPHLDRLKTNVRVKAFLSGAAPAVIGCIFAGCFPLLKALYTQSIVGMTFSVILMGISLLAFIKTKLPIPLIIIIAAIVGALIG